MLLLNNIDDDGFNGIIISYIITNLYIFFVFSIGTCLDVYETREREKRKNLGGFKEYNLCEFARKMSFIHKVRRNKN